MSLSSSPDLGRRGQRLEALALANRVRCGASAEKRRIRGLPASVAAREVARIVRDGDGDTVCEGVPVAALILAVPRMGECKTRALLGRLGVGPWRKLRDLTVRQREVVALELEAKAATWERT